MVRHPGEILRDEFLKPLGLTANQIAKRTGVNRSTIGRLLAGQHRLSPEMAGRLGVCFGVPAKWWLQMQLDFDLGQLASSANLAAEVRPIELDPDVLLTPKGVIRLGAAAAPQEPISLSRAELEELPQTSAPSSRIVERVEYEGGSVALVGVDG